MLSSPVTQPVPQTQAQALANACHALWLATLSLMTAYMQQPAPAHRLLLARRIARNLQTLSGQDCFGEACRERFGRLARRWEERGHEKRPGYSTGLRNALQQLL
jgi:hypothetical protein